MNKKYFYVGATLLVLGLIVVACASDSGGADSVAHSCGGSKTD